MYLIDLQLLFKAHIAQDDSYINSLKDTLAYTDYSQARNKEIWFSDALQKQYKTVQCIAMGFNIELTQVHDDSNDSNVVVQTLVPTLVDPNFSSIVKFTPETPIMNCRYYLLHRDVTHGRICVLTSAISAKNLKDILVTGDGEKLVLRSFSNNSFISIRLNLDPRKGSVDGLGISGKYDDGDRVNFYPMAMTSDVSMLKQIIDTTFHNVRTANNVPIFIEYHAEDKLLTYAMPKAQKSDKISSMPLTDVQYYRGQLTDEDLKIASAGVPLIITQGPIDNPEPRYANCYVLYNRKLYYIDGNHNREELDITDFESFDQVLKRISSNNLDYGIHLNDNDIRDLVTHHTATHHAPPENVRYQYIVDQLRSGHFKELNSYSPKFNSRGSYAQSIFPFIWGGIAKNATAELLETCEMIQQDDSYRYYQLPVETIPAILVVEKDRPSIINVFHPNYNYIEHALPLDLNVTYLKIVDNNQLLHMKGFSHKEQKLYELKVYLETRHGHNFVQIEPTKEPIQPNTIQFSIQDRDDTHYRIGEHTINCKDDILKLKSIKGRPIEKIEAIMHGRNGDYSSVGFLSHDKLPLLQVLAEDYEKCQKNKITPQEIASILNGFMKYYNETGKDEITVWNTRYKLHWRFVIQPGYSAPWSRPAGLVLSPFDDQQFAASDCVLENCTTGGTFGFATASIPLIEEYAFFQRGAYYFDIDQFMKFFFNFDHQLAIFRSSNYEEYQQKHQLFSSNKNWGGVHVLSKDIYDNSIQYSPNQVAETILNEIRAYIAELNYTRAEELCAQLVRLDCSPAWYIEALSLQVEWLGSHASHYLHFRDAERIIDKLKELFASKHVDDSSSLEKLQLLCIDFYKKYYKAMVLSNLSAEVQKTTLDQLLLITTEYAEFLMNQNKPIEPLIQELKIVFDDLKLDSERSSKLLYDFKHTVLSKNKSYFASVKDIPISGYARNHVYLNYHPQKDIVEYTACDAYDNKKQISGTLSPDDLQGTQLNWADLLQFLETSNHCYFLVQDSLSTILTKRGHVFSINSLYIQIVDKIVDCIRQINPHRVIEQPQIVPAVDEHMPIVLDALDGASNSKNEDVVFVKSILDALKHCKNKIDVYNNPLTNYKHGFHYFKSHQAANREANYILIGKLIDMINKKFKELSSVNPAQLRAEVTDLFTSHNLNSSRQNTKHFGNVSNSPELKHIVHQIRNGNTIDINELSQFVSDDKKKNMPQPPATRQ